MYARIEKGQVIEYPILDIRSMYPNTSFPLEIKDTDLPDGLVIVYPELEIPSIQSGKKIEESLPVLVNGKYHRKYVLVNISNEENLQLTASKAMEVRMKRDQLLAKSDWTQFKDISESVSTLWAPYRQALRDITDQPGFPFNIVWPQDPSFPSRK